MPIISTNDGGPKEIRSKCDNGLLVNVNDINELKLILEKGISNNSQWKIYGVEMGLKEFIDTLVGICMFVVIYHY